MRRGIKRLVPAFVASAVGAVGCLVLRFAPVFYVSPWEYPAFRLVYSLPAWALLAVAAGCVLELRYGYTLVRWVGRRLK